VKILSKYVLKEHVGPLTFALTALTSLMLLNFISRQFGELVGKGLPWTVITEFFLLSIPFTVALTVPMSVLVAVLYAFSRLAAENEVTALKASGVSPWRLVSPAIAGGVVASLALLAFNDQVLPLANHRLKTLTDDIQQTKPTFALKEQVINPIAEGKFYLKAGKIDRGAKGRMKEVVIYDLADPTQRRTIYADSGRIGMASNGRDVVLDLYHGQMQEVATDKPGQLNRLFYDHDLIRVRDVARDFQKSDSQTSSKGDREMGVCEMQRRLWQAEGTYVQAQRELDEVEHPPKTRRYDVAVPPNPRIPEPRGLGWLYCRALDGLLRVRSAHAAEVDPATLHRGVPAQDTVARRDSTVRLDSTRARRDSIARLDSARARRDSVRRGAARGTPKVTFTPAPPARPTQLTDSARAAQMREGIRAQADLANAGPIVARTAEAKMRLDMAKLSRNRYDIEINKKFALAAACLIFVLVGAPLAVRFPRGGVGLVIGVSLVVFALYYVGLIGGEALANAGIVPPFWAMWGTNAMLTALGVVLLLRMGRDSGSNRGGDWGDRLDALRARFGRGPQAGASGEGGGPR
jgi:lipopolysaccharide export system permease protein